MRYAISSV